MMWGPWRVEEEFRYQSNDIDSFAGVKAARLEPSLRLHDQRAVRFQPRFGVVAASRRRYRRGRSDQRCAQSPGFGAISDNDDWEFGYQGIAGVRYSINPNLALDVDYRYLATADANYRTTAALGGVNVKSSYNSHNIVASLTCVFGAPPPPPPAPAAIPAPPPPPSRQGVPGLLRLGPRHDHAGRACRSSSRRPPRSGPAHRCRSRLPATPTGRARRATTSGSPSGARTTSPTHSRGIGVPRNQMAVSGRGENDNRVPTADGVREPQNRRVEIVLP